MEHNVEETKLKSGAKGLLIDVPGSSVVNVRIYFRAGFQLGDFSKYEAPHVIEHHVFNGTRAYPGHNEIMTEFERNGATVNAFTSDDYIGYWFECAEFEVGRMLELLTELVARPAFPAAHYDTERGNVRSELQRAASEWGSVAAVLNAEKNYPWRSLNFKTRIEQLDTITHEDVVGHYHATHHARNAAFAVSGAVAEAREDILAGLEGLFGALERGEKRELRDDIGLGQPAPIVQTEAISSIYYNLRWYAEGGTRAEEAALQLLKTLLTGGFASRIMGRVRREGLAYGISSGFGHTPHAASWRVNGFSDPEKIDRLLRLVGEEAARVVEEGVDADELEAARRRVVGAVTVGTQTVSSIASWYLGDYAHNERIESYDEYFRLLQEVTPEAVGKAAAKMLLEKRRSASFVGPLDGSRAEELTGLLAPVWRS